MKDNEAVNGNNGRGERMEIIDEDNATIDGDNDDLARKLTDNAPYSVFNLFSRCNPPYMCLKGYNEEEM